MTSYLRTNRPPVVGHRERRDQKRPEWRASQGGWKDDLNQARSDAAVHNRALRWERVLERWAAAREFDAAYRRCGGT